ncbi:MAG: hypothetical protein Q8T11_09320 [Elusimicrobiota bacterium]|nr:hypothetical protein [Elusimicrobiota bacterium]
MPQLILEFVIEFLPIALGALFIWWISRIGPEVDKKIVRMTSKYFQPAAWLISWLMCTAILAWAFVVTYFAPNKIWALVIVGVVPIAHLILMLKKKYSLAYWCASAEVLITLVAFGYYCVGNPERGQLTINISPGTIGFWFFIGGSLVLVCTAWICHRAAKDIWNGTGVGN